MIDFPGGPIEKDDGLRERFISTRNRGSMAWGLASFWAIMSIRLAIQEQLA